MCAALARPHLFRETPDKEIVDDPDADISTVQIKLLDPDGVERWHRLAMGAIDETACGIRYDFRQDKRGQRLGGYTETLCTDCHTTKELEKSAAANAAVKAEHDDAWERRRARFKHNRKD